MMPVLKAARPAFLAQPQIDAFVRALNMETAAYRAAHADDPYSTGLTPNSLALNLEADASTTRAIDCQQALLAVAADDIFDDIERSGDLDYLQAIALAHRRWLVMDGAYSDEHRQTECRMVDIVLRGSRYDAVPLLWHLEGKPTEGRPHVDLLQAGWSRTPPSHVQAREGTDAR